MCTRPFRSTTAVSVVDDYEASFDFTGMLRFVDYVMADDRDELQAENRIEGDNALVDQ